MFANGSVYELDNYIKLRKFGANKALKLKLKQDKGFADEYMFIADVIQGKQKNAAIFDAFVSHKLVIESKSQLEITE